MAEYSEGDGTDRVVLYTRDGCHLCERLAALLDPHLQARGLTLRHRDITMRRDWLRSYRLRIPVLAIDGRVVLEGRPEAAEVAAALEACLGPGR